REPQILLAVRQGLRTPFGLHQALADIGNVLAEGEERIAGDRLADEVADQEPKQRVALDRGDRDRRPGVLGQRLPAPLREGVDGAGARLARLRARRKVAVRGQALRLRVVLALTGP